MMKNFIVLALFVLGLNFSPAMAKSVSYETAVKYPLCDVKDHASGPYKGKGLYKNNVLVKMWPVASRNTPMCVMNGYDVVKRSGKRYHRICHNEIADIYTISAPTKKSSSRFTINKEVLNMQIGDTQVAKKSNNYSSFSYVEGTDISLVQTQTTDVKTDVSLDLDIDSSLSVIEEEAPQGQGGAAGAIPNVHIPVGAGGAAGNNTPVVVIDNSSAPVGAGGSGGK